MPQVIRSVIVYFIHIKGNNRKVIYKFIFLQHVKYNNKRKIFKTRGSQQTLLDRG